MLSFSNQPKSLYILRLSAIGDICHTVPEMRTMQTVWPKTQITWIVGRVEAQLIGDIPGVEFIIFDKGAGHTAFKNLRQALKIGGRMFVIVGQSPVMEALLITRVGETEWTTQSLFETDLPRLES